VIGDPARERLADALIHNLTYHGDQFRTRNPCVRPGFDGRRMMSLHRPLPHSLQ
jgi:hypothetical protein